jgi:hypothetical protein
MARRLVDNQRLKLSDVLLEEMPNHEVLSIATGYIDLPGFELLSEALSQYKSVRILIGQEPLPPQYSQGAVNLAKLDETFPETQLQLSLEQLEQHESMRMAAKNLRDWISEGRVSIKIYRGNFLHAKAYIFGELESHKAVGIIGSSNFTRRGLTENLELNYVEDDVHKVTYPALNSDQPHGHLSWFNEIWDGENVEDWDGKFQELIDSSPLGELTFSQYEMYIKALYEIYEDELVKDLDQLASLSDILYSFQLRNATLLIRKLEKHGIAMLADSVGLGKTITAGAVVQNYIQDKNASRIYIIAPASLASQWKSELADVFKLFSGFEIISLQDVNKIRQARELDKFAPVDLFVIDEAHNLRSGAGARFNEILEWFSDNPDSHVLMLTATPINNSLKDIKNQIQLASKGKLESFPVVYPTDGKVEVIDFYEAIDRLNASIKSALTSGKEPDYDRVNDVMRQGLRQFMVRTTRRGLEKEFGGIKTADGKVLKFPQEVLKPQMYDFNTSLVPKLEDLIQANIVTFEGFNVRQLDVTWLLDKTQRTEHPLDSISQDSLAFNGSVSNSPFEIIFQSLLLLGFAPYKSDIYRHKYLHKSVEEIASYKANPQEKLLVASQLSIHNMLRVTLLKRLESSQYALRVSLENYKSKLIKFQTILLQQNKIARISDLDSVLDLFEGQEENYDVQLEEDEVLFIDADPQHFNVDALKNDLLRDLALLDVLIEMCGILGEQDDKLQSLADLINSIAESGTSGKKVLIFSYFADTISYLEKSLPSLVTLPDFNSRSGYTAGKSKASIEELAKRFSPISKNSGPAILKLGEIDFLFATDVLSEGQNLQDCGVIVNFDLHWNPVRMIQRNGRINRIGSVYETVKVFNMFPDVNLNEYLALVERLKMKIEQIRHTIGTDQSILGEEANPKEFVDLYDDEKANDVGKRLADEDEVLLTEDEFVNDLRKFDSTATALQKNRVQRIGVGKWGVAPSAAKTHLGTFSALALMRIRGVLSHSGKEFRNNVFIKADEFFGPVENYKALAALRVQPDDGALVKDQIKMDRSDIARKSIARARADAKKNKKFFPFTPSVHRALDELYRYKPELQLTDALNRVQTIQTKKRANRLVMLINSSVKQHGHLTQEVIDQVENFITYMSKFEIPKIKLADESILGVLYFAK